MTKTERVVLRRALQRVVWGTVRHSRPSVQHYVIVRGFGGVRVPRFVVHFCERYGR